MAKNKVASPNLFEGFRSPIKEHETMQEAVEDIKIESPLENNNIKEKSIEDNRDLNLSDEPIEVSNIKKKPGRHKNEVQKKFKYTDMTYLEDYVTIRAKRLNMFMSDYLRMLVLKDAKDNLDLFKTLVDMTKVSGEFEKYGISL